VLWVAGFRDDSSVKKTHLFDRREFCVFSLKQRATRELAVASHPTVTARFSYRNIPSGAVPLFWFVLLTRQNKRSARLADVSLEKNEHGSSIHTKNQTLQIAILINPSTYR
jgi:hypothetical protein